MTVNQLLNETDARELHGWIDHERRNGPLGEKRQDFHFAMLCSLVANIHRGAKQNAFKPEDFMPFEEKPDWRADKARALQQYRKHNRPR